MNTGGYQDDLFGEEYKDKKARKTSFFDKYSPQRFLPHIKIPIEYTIILLIVMLVLIIIAYAVGVEVGKKSLDPRAAEEKVLYEAKVEQLKTEMEERLAQEKIEEKVPEEPPVVEEVATEEPEQEIISSQEPGYVIQLASFKNKFSAEQEIGKLKDKDLPAFLYESGDWYMVRVGNYKTIEKAREMRDSLQERYRDCYIKRVD